MFSAIKSDEIGFAIMQYGKELDLPGPISSFQEIQIIHGKPACSAQLLWSLAQRDGVKIEVLQSTETICKIKATRGEISNITEYTSEEVKSAGLLSNPMWGKYPKDMLWARCVSRMVRRNAPSAAMGMYTTEEVESFEQKNTSQTDLNERNSAPPPDVDKPNEKKAKTKTEPFMGKYRKIILSCQPEIEKVLGVPFNHGKHYESAVNQWIESIGKKLDLKFAEYLENNTALFIEKFCAYRTEKSTNNTPAEETQIDEEITETLQEALEALLPKINESINNFPVGIPPFKGTNDLLVYIKERIESDPYEIENYIAMEQFYKSLLANCEVDAKKIADEQEAKEAND